MEEIQYLRLPSGTTATNIFSLATFEHADKQKVLVATKTELFIVESVEAGHQTGIKFRSFPFPTPHNSQILAVDSFTRGPHKAPTIVVLVAAADGKASLIAYGLNSSAFVPLITLSNDSCSIPLDFVPLCLYHTSFRHGESDKEQHIILLSSFDGKMHLYKQEEFSEPSTLVEASASQHLLPEFKEVSGPPLCMNIWQGHGTRVSAYGCPNGLVSLSIVNEQGTRREEVMLEGPISTVKVFSPWSSRDCSSIHPHVLKLYKNMEKASARAQSRPSSTTLSPESLNTSQDSLQQPEEEFSFSCHPPTDDLHLVVGGAQGYAIVYSSIIKSGLSKPIQLDKSEMFDSILSCEVTDIDWDGQNEILFTTYSQELLVYKLTAEEPSLSSAPERSLSQFLATPSRSRSLSARLQNLKGESQGMSGKRNLSFPNLSASDSLTAIEEVGETHSRSLTTDSFDVLEAIAEQEEENREPEYHLAWRHSYPQPIFGVRAFDITNDGINEVIVSSQNGLHISQMDFHMGRYRVLQRLELLREIAQLERDLSRLEPQE